MNEIVRKAWKSTIFDCMRDLEATPITDSALMYRWSRSGLSGWTGTVVVEPDPTMTIARFVFDTLGSKLARHMERHYPEHCNLVGTRTFGQWNLGIRGHLGAVCGELYRRNQSFSVSEESVNSVVDDIAAFIDTKHVVTDFIVPLVNLKCTGETEEITLTRDVRIRRLSDEEINTFFGGRLGVPNMGSNCSYSPLSYALCGSFEEQKMFGSVDNPDTVPEESLLAAIDNSITALRTFKSGPIGYDSVHLQPKRFTPYLNPVGRRWADSYIPLGSYRIAKDEVEELTEHAGYLQGELHPSMKSACSRLAAAEVRTNLQERLFDAVVGLEAILLTDVNEDKYHGEPRYRFAMNLGVLQNSPAERLHYYRVGKKLYDLRSKVAHGGEIDVRKVIKCDGEKLALPELATMSCDLLRRIIKSFLPEPVPPYLKSGYWEKRYFPTGRPGN